MYIVWDGKNKWNDKKKDRQPLENTLHVYRPEVSAKVSWEEQVPVKTPKKFKFNECTGKWTGNYWWQRKGMVSGHVAGWTQTHIIHMSTMSSTNNQEYILINSLTTL